MLKISEVNQLGFEDFVEAFHSVIEGCPIVAASIWDDHPFQDVESLHNCIDKFVQALPQTGQVGILRCHPDLAGKIATAGKLTTESTMEQRAAGLDDISEEEKLMLDQLNERYKLKFGFPFVICARENKKDAILNGMSERINNDRDTEISTGIREVKKICGLRLKNIVKEG